MLALLLLLLLLLRDFSEVEAELRLDSLAVESLTCVVFDTGVDVDEEDELEDSDEYDVGTDDDVCVVDEEGRDVI